MSISTIILIIIGVIVFFGLIGFCAWIWAAKKMFRAQKDFMDDFKNF